MQPAHFLQESRSWEPCGNDLRGLTVCNDLHVSNSLEILGKSDWETDLTSSRARYDAHIQD
jgi:hypothetical protein